MELLERLEKEWPVMKGAPLSMAFIVIVLIAIVWALVSYLKSNQLDNLNSQIETQKSQIEMHKAQIELVKATMDQLAVQLADARQREQIVASQQTPVISKPEVVSPIEPLFRMLMFGGNVFQPTGVASLTGISLTVRIWNTGQSSVATKWSLMVIPPRGMPVHAQFTAIPPEGVTASGPINSAVIRASDALDVKTQKDPVPEVPLEGTLLFYVKLDKKMVVNKQTKLELSVQDIYGHEFVTSQVMGNWLQR